MSREREKKEEGSLNEEISLLKKSLEDTLKQKQECEERIKDLRLKENPRLGVVYAQELFSLQQDKLRLEVEADIVRKRINRLSWEE